MVGVELEVPLNPPEPVPPTFGAPYAAGYLLPMPAMSAGFPCPV
jgi:hypothetical protein